MLFIAQVALIIAVARLLGMGARRLGQPMVMAEILAGILLGPSLLGWVAPGFSAALFPHSALPVLSVVSQLGLLLFMFVIGLELDPRLLRERARASLIISHTSIVVPFALGVGLALYLHPRLSQPSVSVLSFALFMGAAMSVTAFPVLARILAERRLQHTRIGAIALTCAAIDDVTAWCILAFVVSVARARGLGHAARTTLLAGLYIVVMLTVVQPILRRLAAPRVVRKGVTQNGIALILLLLLASAWLTELIGIHALFGAFLLGAVSPKHGGYVRALSGKLEDLVVVLLLPLFFAYSGLRTQVNLLNSPADWGQCALIIALACLGKFGGSAAAARLTGLNWRESATLGVLMNTRGLMELIVLNVGLDVGVLSPRLFTMMVLMALFTTFLTTPLLRLVEPQKAPDRPGSAHAPA